MNIARTANSIYFALKDDTAAIAAMRAEFATLALALANDPDAAATVTSATVNNQTFSSAPLMTNEHRFLLLRNIIDRIDNGGAVSSTQLTRF